MRKLFFILFIALFNETVVSQQISNIKFIYAHENTHIPVIIPCISDSCNIYLRENINLLTTYDDIYITIFKESFDKLSPKGSDKPIKKINPRIMSIIFYEDSISNDSIYFDKYNRIYKNGIPMKNNDRLLNLVKKKIGWKNNIKNLLDLLKPTDK